MRLPPTRYKVVERGRRLEVIDTWTGGPASPRLVDHERPAERGTLAAPLHAPKLDSRGRRVFTSAGWYDAKGPREIVLSEAGERRVAGLKIGAIVLLVLIAIVAFIFWPLLLLLPFLLLRADTRKALRTQGAAFLDGINQPLTGSSSG
ncbi:hypothetical protein [Sphingomonas sp. M1-B02]|uniref:hypothetical protein n=1 Tax=Sphingomonas sp. M1-B02 TaxID=3114300 RepID=UPI0022405F81|nr:hypothetical protein [Sphingomonas sp. S6-11]UZK65283.1 hypothetical protein OKW87_12260 [Sphingomonas sp. S6-11]